MALQKIGASEPILRHGKNLKEVFYKIVEKKEKDKHARQVRNQPKNS